MYSYANSDWYFSIMDRTSSLINRRRRYRSKSFSDLKLNPILVIIVAILMQSVVSIAAQASSRVALVLACENYENFKASPVSVKWARELGEALKEQNFDVTLATNLNDAETRASLREFSSKAEQADFALIVVSGHIATYQNQSFFMPQNARIRRATDLYSRALSLPSIADIGGKAKSGALLLFTTVPDIPATIADLNERPAANRLQAENVVTVFSSSPKVPVSSIDRVSEQAAQKLLDAARVKPLTLTALVDAASAGGIGLVFGNVSPTNLSAASDQPVRQDTSKAEILQAAEKAAKARAEAEHKAREASLARDQAEAERKAAEDRMRAEKERARLAEERAREAELRAKQAQEEAQKVTSLRSVQVVEDSLTSYNRRQIQRRLRALRLYRGNIDAVFGPLTREAIREFQRLAGAPETGYLTKSQFERLVDTQ